MVDAVKGRSVTKDLTVWAQKHARYTIVPPSSGYSGYFFTYFSLYTQLGGLPKQSTRYIRGVGVCQPLLSGRIIRSGLRKLGKCFCVRMHRTSYGWQMCVVRSLLWYCRVWKRFRIREKESCLAKIDVFEKLCFLNRDWKGFACNRLLNKWFWLFFKFLNMIYRFFLNNLDRVIKNYVDLMSKI